MSFRQMWRCESSIAVSALRPGRIALQGHDSRKHAQCGFEAKKKKKKYIKTKIKNGIFEFVIRDNSTHTDRSAGKSRRATRTARLDSRHFLLRAPKTSGWLDPSSSCATMHDVGAAIFAINFFAILRRARTMKLQNLARRLSSYLGYFATFAACSLGS